MLPVGYMYQEGCRDWQYMLLSCMVVVKTQYRRSVLAAANGPRSEAVGESHVFEAMNASFAVAQQQLCPNFPFMVGQLSEELARS